MEPTHIIKPNWANQVEASFKGDYLPYSQKPVIHDHIVATGSGGSFLFVGKHDEDLAERWNAMFKRSWK